MHYDCLVIDDERTLSESISEYFNAMGVKTAFVTSSQEYHEFSARNNVADLILLDINLGDQSGFDLCRYLRKTIKVPILFISARTSNDDMLLALNIGGDGYIQKPFSLSVLLAKVKAVLNRYQNTTPKLEVLEAGDIKIDFTTGIAYKGGKRIEMKAMEFKLLAYLAKNKNRTVPKNEIFRKVWEEPFVGDNTLNVHIRYLREMIEEDPSDPQYIQTVWGTGYVFEVEEDE